MIPLDINDSESYFFNIRNLKKIFKSFLLLDNWQVIQMRYISLAGKILLDKDSRKIGLIVKVIKALDIKANGNEKNTKIIVRVERALRKEILIEIAAKIVSTVEGRYAWLSITRKEFSALIRDIPRIKPQVIPHKNIDLSVLKNYRGGPPRT